VISEGQGISPTCFPMPDLKIDRRLLGLSQLSSGLYYLIVVILLVFSKTTKESPELRECLDNDIVPV
jgi:hypothetical protein